MLTLHQHPFELLEQQLRAAERPAAERVPAAEVNETDTAYVITLELAGVDKISIDVKATDRSLVINAERRQPSPDSSSTGAKQVSLISEFRYGTWSRSFRFPGGINRESLQAHYRGGLLTVTAPKAQNLTTVQVQVEG
jgi:Molecular chaperone (small heat shock protein)